MSEDTAKLVSEDTANPVYGGFWWRMLAYIIDALVLLVIGIFINFVISMIISGGTMELSEGAMKTSAGASLATILAFTYILLTILIPWLYYSILQSSKMQATLGKAMCGMKVTGLDGNRISFLRATGRFFAKILSTLILLIGYFMTGWTARKQGLHDKIAGTLVVRKVAR